ncbi:MAG: PPOX class F420-dependent oxidoreductase [Propionibacteriales bacterium]|nr:PPOX class F420-dependent oxidoreductase [Propionibacteriales bacterium]
MSVFNEAELAYLRARPGLARIATVGRDGTPHVTPVGWSLDPSAEVIEVGGINLAATKKFRDVARGGRAAIVIDDLLSTSPWRPRGIEIRGRAEAVTDPEPRIRIHPERIISWGFDGAGARTVVRRNAAPQ